MVKFFYNERGQRIKKESYNTSTFALNSTDYYILDLSGNAMAIYNQPVSSAITQKDLPIFGLSRLGVCNRTGISNYEITDHLGNVRAVIQKLSGNPVIKSFADYYPFGEQLVGRSVTNDYRYAFQGQELDGETGMEAFQLRLWDGRIGRWLSPDPMGQYASPYLGMGNSPINGSDINGGIFVKGLGITDQQFNSWKNRMKKIIGASKFDYLDSHAVHITVNFTNAPIQQGRLNGFTNIALEIKNNAANLFTKQVEIIKSNGTNNVMTGAMEFFFRPNPFPIIAQSTGNFSETFSKLQNNISISSIDITIDYTKRFDTNSHELGHAYFALQNPELHYMWMAIENSWKYSNPNGEGHLFNNPSGIMAGVFQNLTSASESMKILNPRDF